MNQPVGSFSSLVASLEGKHVALLALLVVGFTLLVNQAAAWGKHVARHLLEPKH